MTQPASPQVWTIAPRQAAADEPADVRAMRITTRLLVLALVAGALVAAGLWVARLPAFNLRAIRVEGDLKHQHAAALRAGVMPRLHGNFLTMDLNAARSAFEQQPWVRSVQVRRLWPMRLSVRIEEHRAAAYWTGGDGEEKLVNRHGEIFEANAADIDEDLPTLEGPADRAASMLALAQLLAPRVEPLAAGMVETLALSPNGQWTLRLDQGATIALGRGTPDEVAQRFDRFAAALPQVEQGFQRRLVAADLRHTGGFALKLDAPRTAAAASQASATSESTTTATAAPGAMPVAAASASASPAAARPARRVRRGALRGTDAEPARAVALLGAAQRPATLQRPDRII